MILNCLLIILRAAMINDKFQQVFLLLEKYFNSSQLYNAFLSLSVVKTTEKEEVNYSL